jgi:hypothetical protein
MTVHRTDIITLVATILLIAVNQTTANDWPSTRQIPDPTAEQTATMRGTTLDSQSVDPVVAKPAENHGWAFEDWRDEVDRKLDDQARIIHGPLTRGLVAIGVLVGLCLVSIACLWGKLPQLSAADSRSTDQSPTEADACPSGLAADGTSAEQRLPHGPPVDEGSVKGSVPRVQFISGVIERLVAGINESRQRRGEMETGYALVGKIIGEGRSRTILVSSLIDEGDDATRTCSHIKFNRTYQQNELCLLQLVDADLMHVGDAHLHPGAMDFCSGGDHQTDTRNVRDSHSQEMVFVIATKASAHGGSRSPVSIYYAGLKLDFFYLGKTSGYEYQPFRPDIVRGQVVAASEELRRFATVDRVRARLDFDNLRRLTDYRMTMTELPTDGEHRRPCIEMTHKTRGFKTLIAFSADPSERPEVFVDDGTQLMQFQPAWLNGSWLPGLVWFTPIVLNVEREMTGRHNVDAGSDTETSVRVRSAHAEVKISGPSIGDNHGKFSATECGTSRGNPSGDVTLPVRE